MEYGASAASLSGDPVPQHVFGATQGRAIGQDGEKRDRIVFGDRDVDDLDSDVLTGELVDTRCGRTAQIAPPHLLRRLIVPLGSAAREEPRAIR